MIIREANDSFMMIEQHHHAKISGDLFQQLYKSFSPSNYDSLKFAIINHDYGWIPIDITPIWNDIKRHPYSFTDFPVPFKTILYRYGINQVQEKDLYAALLCSQHYCRFLQKNDTDLVKQFLHQEKVRQQDIIAQLTHLDEQEFQSHVSILQFFDSLSLYICLNKPGVLKENEHLYFKDGIPLPSSFGGGLLQAEWVAKDRIRIDHNLFKEKVKGNYFYKRVEKDLIKEKGIAQAYADTQYDEQILTISH